MLPLAEVKAHLGITGDASDGQLAALVDRATAIVERELHWYFRDPRDAVEVLDGTGEASMWLRQPPVDEGAVTVENRTGVGDAWEAVDATDYEVDGRGLYAAGEWARGKRNFRVSYREGFIDPPGDVAQLVLDLVASVWRDKGKEGLRSERIGDYSYTRADLEDQPRWGNVRSNWERRRV